MFFIEHNYYKPVHNPEKDARIREKKLFSVENFKKQKLLAEV
ncbi:MAG: hypothetical protein RXR18_05920 [Nitrososphaeria archaeon]